MFNEPFPFYVKVCWAIGGSMLVLYPTVRVSHSSFAIQTFGVYSTFAVWYPKCQEISQAQREETEEGD